MLSNFKEDGVFTKRSLLRTLAVSISISTVSVMIANILRGRIFLKV